MSGIRSNVGDALALSEGSRVREEPQNEKILAPFVFAKTLRESEKSIAVL
jgi:hypothetical protein